MEALLDHWSSIEASIKQAELVNGFVPVPAINELRYAGRQLIRAFRLLGDPKADDEYVKAVNNAEQYLINADHDVTDATVVFIGRRVSELNRRYGRPAVEKVDPNYSEINKSIEFCRQEIQTSRFDLSRRDEIYRFLKNTEVPRLISLFKDFEKTDALMIAESALKSNEIERLELKNLYASLYATVVSVFLLLLILWTICRSF